MKFPLILLFSAALLWSACTSTKPRHAFDDYPIPPSPDYSNENNWAALPGKLDAADSVPLGLTDNQMQSQADVFFLHPTTYTRRKGNNQWNADVRIEKINHFTDITSIAYQASIFNGVGKVYAPRYRQAHYKSFFTKDKESAKKALDLAYSDIKKSFEYYLTNYNNGRPIILAAHSQGTLHLIRLLKEYFDNDSTKNKLVVAYAVGYTVPISSFNYLKPCTTRYETSCICSWRTFKKGYDGKYVQDSSIVITNPLNWTSEPDIYVERSQNLGFVLDDINKAPVIGLTGAQIHKGVLWVDKPKFKGSYLYPFPNYHRGDFNIFYMNVRENAKERLGAYWK